MTNSSGIWNQLEQWSPTAFLLAGGLFLVNIVIIVSGIITGSERMTEFVGEAFNAAGWAVALVGLLGLYLGVADRSRWLSRIAAICATIGVVFFTLLVPLSLAFYFGVIEGDIQDLVPLLLPGTFVGGVLSFLLFGIASLRTGAYPRAVGILLLLPPTIVFVNIFAGATGLASEYFLLGIVGGLLVVSLLISSKLRSASLSTQRTDSMAESGVD